MSYSITTRRTPNRSRRSGTLPIYLVTHHTIGGYAGSVSWLCNPAAQASADEVIQRDGSHVTNLNPTGDGYYTWQVGNANSLCGAGFELEALTIDVTFPDSLYDTLALRMKVRQRALKKKYGVTIPLKHSTVKGTPGIVAHKQLAGWYGGSDHSDGVIDFAKLEEKCGTNIVKLYIRVKFGHGGRKFLIGNHAQKRSTAYVAKLLKAGRNKISVTRDH